MVGRKQELEITQLLHVLAQKFFIGAGKLHNHQAETIVRQVAFAPTSIRMWLVYRERLLQLAILEVKERRHRLHVHRKTIVVSYLATIAE